MRIQRDGPKRPGPVYDRVARLVIEDDPGAVCDWLGLAHESEIRQLPATFAAETIEADYVAKIGPGRILHIECVTQPDLEQAHRIVAYRAQIMRRHPYCSVFQFAIMLRGGRLPDVDDPPSGFYLGLTKIHLNQVDPDELLARPNLACLAVLAQGDEEARRRYLSEALRAVHDLPETRQSKLLHAVLVLASMTVDGHTIEEILEEDGMTEETIAEFYRDTKFSRLIEKQAHDQGLEEGLEQGTARTLTALLRTRFGNHSQIPAIARNLAHSVDTDTSIGIVTEAKSLDDLSDWVEAPTS